MTQPYKVSVPEITIPSASEGVYSRLIWTIALGIALLASLQAAWALSIGSRQLFKDATDWTYDVLLYGLAAAVFGCGARIERISALIIAAIMAVAGFHTLYDLWDKVVAPRPVEVTTLGFSATSAILVGWLVLGALLRFRGDPNPLIKATWVTARNDAITTSLFAVVIFVIRMAPVRWPVYALDVVGAALCFQATFAIVRTAQTNQQSE